MRHSRQTPSIRVALALSTALLAAAVGILVLAHTRPPDSKSNRPGSPVPGFSILNPVTPRAVEKLPAPTRLALGGPTGQAIAGIGTTTAGAERISVASGLNSICVTNTSENAPGGSCGTVSDARASGLITAGFCSPGSPDGEAAILGLVPDSVRAVDIDSGADGSIDATARVSENVFTAEVPATPTTIIAVGSSIRETMPLDRFVEANSPCS